MGFTGAVRTVFSKYATFSGRARRREYWYWALFMILLTIVTTAADISLGTIDDSGNGLIGTVVTLALLLPGLAVTARRLHDTDRRGWWILIGFIPLIGFIVLLVFCVQDSNDGMNRFGPSPKYAAA